MNISLSCSATLSIFMTLWLDGVLSVTDKYPISFIDTGEARLQSIKYKVAFLKRYGTSGVVIRPIVGSF